MRKKHDNNKNNYDPKLKKQQKQNKNNPESFKYLEAKTQNQKDYIRNIAENDVIFCTGPSGCGKSFIAAGLAAQKLHFNEIDSIIITRPLVCTGKDIGSLPGELLEKISPYLMPMEENLRFFLGRSYYGQHYNDGRIKYLPLEVMRGSTFNKSYMILDEAQNCSFEQIKMFLTRIGQDSKVLINGDIKQSDIRNKSGLSQCIERLRNIQGIGISQLSYEDIQRNGLIGKILTALED